MPSPLRVTDLPPGHTLWTWMWAGIAQQPGTALVALLASLALPVVAIPLLFLPAALFAPLWLVLLGHTLGVPAWLALLVSPLAGIAFLLISAVAILLAGLVFALFFFVAGLVGSLLILLVSTMIEPWWLRTVTGYRPLNHDERKQIAQRRLPGTHRTALAAGTIVPEAEPHPVYMHPPSPEALDEKGTDSGALISAAKKLGLCAVPPVLVEDNEPMVHATTYARAIVVSRGFLDADAGTQAAILAHELDHWVSCQIAGQRFALWGCGLPIYAIEVIRTNLNARNILGLLYMVAFWPVHLLWTFLVMPVVTRAGRAAEYAADATAVSVYGDYPKVLASLRDVEPARSGWDRTILATHPPIALRIERVQTPYREDPEPPHLRRWPLLTAAVLCVFSYLAEVRVWASIPTLPALSIPLPATPAPATGSSFGPPVSTATPTPTPAPTPTSLPTGPLAGTWHEVRRIVIGVTMPSEHQTVEFLPGGRFVNHGGDLFSNGNWTGTYRIGPHHSLNATSSDGLHILRGTYHIGRNHRLRVDTTNGSIVVFARG